MPPNLKNHKDLIQITILLRLISKHLQELSHFKQQGQALNFSKIQAYISANTRIKNHVVRKGAQIKELSKIDEMRPHAVLAMRCFAMMLLGLEGLDNKMQVMSEDLSSNSIS